MIFSDQFRKIIICYKRTGYNMNVMRQTACLVVNPITVDNCAALFNCTTAGHPIYGSLNFHLGWLGLDAVSLVGPTGVQLLGFCCSSVSVLFLLLSTQIVLSQCWILDCMFAGLMHWWVEVPHADRTTFNICLWTTAEPRIRVVANDRSKAVLLL